MRIKYKELRTRVNKIIPPPIKVLVAGISFKNIQTQMGAIMVSTIINKLISEAGSVFVPRAIKSLEAGAIIKPAIINIYKLSIFISKLFAKIKAITKVKNPELEVTASLFTFLCLDKNTKAKEKKLAHKKAYINFQSLYFLDFGNKILQKDQGK